MLLRYIHNIKFNIKKKQLKKYVLFYIKNAFEKRNYINFKLKFLYNY